MRAFVDSMLTDIKDKRCKSHKDFMKKLEGNSGRLVPKTYDKTCQTREALDQLLVFHMSNPNQIREITGIVVGSLQNPYQQYCKEGQDVPEIKPPDLAHNTHGIFQSHCQFVFDGILLRGSKDKIFFSTNRQQSPLSLRQNKNRGF